MPSGSWERIWPKAIAPLLRRSMVLGADAGSWACGKTRRDGRTTEARRTRSTEEGLKKEGDSEAFMGFSCLIDSVLLCVLCVLCVPGSLLLLRFPALDDALAQALAEGDLAQEQRGEALRAGRPAHGPVDLDVDPVLERVLGVGRRLSAVEEAGIARDLLVLHVARLAGDLVAQLVEQERE